MCAAVPLNPSEVDWKNFKCVWNVIDSSLTKMVHSMKLVILAAIVVAAHTAFGAIDRLQIHKAASDYLDTATNLWRVIDRRAENTLEQIYYNHKTVLNENYFQNFAVRSRISYNGSLDDALTLVTDKSVRALNLLKNRDYGGLNDFVRSTVDIVVQALADIDAICNSKAFWEDLKSESSVCKQHYTVNHQAEHQIVLEMYKDVEALYLRGYIIAQLSYMILGLREKEKYRKESDRLRDSFVKRNERIETIVGDVLTWSNRDVSACSPDNYLYVSPEYEEVTSFLQGFVDNEINLNVEQTCTRTCVDYHETRQYGCHKDTLCAQNHIPSKVNVCKGTIRNCQFIDADVEICPSIINKRRYKYVKFGETRNLGVGGDCAYKTQAKSWTNWFVRCHTCFCICDEPNAESERHFNLREVTSDIYSNNIVTGVHLTKHNGMFGLAISERKLLSYGRLKPTNNYFHSNFPSWKVAHPKFKLTDHDVREGVDYHTLTYENRAINFDTVTVPECTAVTGVRFQLNNGHLQIGVRATEFDFETGTLFNLENSTWYTNANSGKNKIVVNKAKPIGLLGRPIVNDIPDAYVEFTPSDVDADAAQSIVPFIETSKVEPIVPTILSGISLIYKGKPGYSGVIAPKLIVYDFAPYFRSITMLED